MIYATAIILFWIFRRLWFHQTEALVNDFRLAFQVIRKIFIFAFKLVNFCITGFTNKASRMVQPSREMKQMQPENI